MGSCLLACVVESRYTASEFSARLTTVLMVRVPNRQGSWLLDAESQLQEGQAGDNLIQEAHDYLAAALTRLLCSEHPWLGLGGIQKPNAHTSRLRPRGNQVCACWNGPGWVGIIAAFLVALLYGTVPSQTINREEGGG